MGHCHAPAFSHASLVFKHFTWYIPLRLLHHIIVCWMRAELWMAFEVALPEFGILLGTHDLVERAFIVGPHLGCNLMREEDGELPAGTSEPIRGSDHCVYIKRITRRSQRAIRCTTKSTPYVSTMLSVRPQAAYVMNSSCASGRRCFRQLASIRGVSLGIDRWIECMDRANG